MADERLADGRARVVRHGHGPERMIQTGIGAVPVERAKLRDHGAEAPGDDRITFTSAILPKWARRSRRRRCAAAGPLPARHLDRRFPGGSGRAAWQGHTPEPLHPGDRRLEEWQADYERWQRRATCRPAVAASGPTASICRRAWRTMPPGRHRRNAGRQEGTGGLSAVRESTRAGANCWSA